MKLLTDASALALLLLPLALVPALACGRPKQTSTVKSALASASAAPVTRAASRPGRSGAAQSAGWWDDYEPDLVWVSGSTVLVWKLEPLELVARLTAPAGVTCADLSPSGTTLMATTETKERIFWDLKTGAHSKLSATEDDPKLGCVATWLPGDAWVNVERVEDGSLVLRHASGRSEVLSGCTYPSRACLGMSLDGSWIHVTTASGCRLRRTEGGDEHLVPASRGLWTAAALFVAVQNEGAGSTTLWDPVKKKALWTLPGVRALSSSPEGDRVLVEHGEGCAASRWSVLSAKTGRVEASFERKGRYCCEPGFVWALRPGQMSSWLVVSDGSRVVLVAPNGNVEARPVSACDPPVLGKRHVLADGTILDLSSLAANTVDELTEHAAWSPSEDFLAGSRFEGAAIWNARTRSIVRTATEATQGGFRWVNASTLLYEPRVGAWRCLISTRDPHRVCLTVVEDGGKPSILALADDGTYSREADWSTLDDRLHQFERPQRLCPNLLASYLEGEPCRAP